jgi:Ca2+-binding EF-hand superfamily protein
MYHGLTHALFANLTAHPCAYPVAHHHHHLLLHHHHFTQDQIKKLFIQFARIDRDSGGDISLSEFYTVLGVKPSHYNERVFGIFDMDHSGALNFQVRKWG